MNSVIVTLDLDWACEASVEETLDFLKRMNIIPTVFITHHSQVVEARMNEIEVGLHPYFGPDSSHGKCIEEVVKYVMDIPHNVPFFRCHRFAICNTSRQAMQEAGMLLSSNVCTDLEIVSPFKDRFGLLEVPIFLEDGGYLWRGHSLEMHTHLKNRLAEKGPKVLLIHPMHFSLNTPNFAYMATIKKSVSRQEWNAMTRSSLEKYRWKGRGIRDLLTEILKNNTHTSTLSSLSSIPKYR